MNPFSRKKKFQVVPLDDRSDVYRKRAKRAKLTIKHKPKPESRSPEPTNAAFLNTVGNYVSSELDSIVPRAELVNFKYQNDYLPKPDILINNAEYVRPPTIIERMHTLIGRPKTHPQEPRVYVFIPSRKDGGKTRRKKNLRKRGRGGTRNSRQ